MTSGFWRTAGNTLANLCDKLLRNLQRHLCGGLMRMNMCLRGIRYGKGLRFYGLARFKRANKARLQIGRACVFHSSPASNLIGVNRPCILTALQPGSRLVVGDHCGFSGTVVGCFHYIQIGHFVRCGANTLITDSDWHLDDPRSGSPAPVIIEDNVWLGVNVTVLKGVRIGANSVIGANSLVVKDVPPNVVAAGNPCKVLRQLPVFSSSPS